MFRVFRSGNYKKKLEKLDGSDYKRVINFEQSLKQKPYSGKPLSYKFFREHQEEYLNHYHKRSNIESTFSMIKRKFGNNVKCKKEIC